MARLKAIKNHIIFQFEDEVVRKSDNGLDRAQFSEVTDWGFQISSFEEGTQKPRWGIVVAIGKDVDKEIKVGSKILIEALQWTNAVKFEGEYYWRTNSDKVLAIDEDYQNN